VLGGRALVGGLVAGGFVGASAASDAARARRLTLFAISC
jgi:hypothetical protein